MNRILPLLLVAALPFLAGCAAVIPAIAMAGYGVSTGMQMKHASDLRKHASDLRTDSDVLMYRQKISQKFTSNPDTDAWHEQRQKIALATGDRIFEKDFARVFDSLVQAASSLELRVDNMERNSGYVSASGISLPPTEAQTMRRQMVNEWCRLNNFDPAVFDRPMATTEMAQTAALIDLDGMMSRYEKAKRGLTFQLVKMGAEKTKVKLRFSEVYYPSEIETYYKLVWQTVDKQIFVDQNVEGAVEKRPEASPDSVTNSDQGGKAK